MISEEDKEWLVDRIEFYTLQFLSNEANYPVVVGGKTAFYDEWTFGEHLKRGIYRDPAHLKDSWEVSCFVDGDDYDYEIKNTKFVGQWNLFEDILSTGTGEYIVPFGKKKMTFWSRYTDQWYFKMQSRGGVGQGFANAMKELIENALDYGEDMALEEFE